MSGDFAHLARCLDLRDADVVEAVSSRERTKALVAHLGLKSAPNTGVAKVLLVFARMSTTACDWLDGDLHVELVGDDEVTVVEALTELGGGLRERVFPPTSFRVPLAEFARAIERVPHLIAPLAIRGRSARRLSLAVSATVRRTSIPPPPIEISAESLFVRVPAHGPSPDDAGAPPLPVITGLPEIGDAPPPAAVAQQAPGEPLLSDVDQGWDD